MWFAIIGLTFGINFFNFKPNIILWLVILISDKEGYTTCVSKYYFNVVFVYLTGLCLLYSKACSTSTAVNYCLLSHTELIRIRALEWTMMF